MPNVLVAIAVVVRLGLGVVSAQDVDTDGAAINARVEALFAAISRGDAEGAAASYHVNAVRVIGNNVVAGRANIEKAMSEAFAAGTVAITFTRDDTRFLTSTTAIVHGAYEVTSATPPTTGRSMLTLVKEGDDWLIAALHAGAATPR